MRYVASQNGFVDAAPETFYKSGTHGLRWFSAGGLPVVVIADRNWSATTPVEEKCHYCASTFVYRTYRWDESSSSFSKYRTIKGVEAYEAAEEALDGDAALIRAGLNP